MNIDFITKEDLENFKKELIAEMQTLLQQPTRDDLLRSKDVRKLLGISAGKLQTLRVNKTIPSFKLDKTWYYSMKAIEEVLQKNMKNTCNNSIQVKC